MIDTLYDKKISSIGLSLFRICFGLVLLAEICQIFNFRHLIFDYIPYIEESEIRFRFPIIIWAVAVVFIILGLFTRAATIISYIMSLTLIGSIKSYEYHMFYAYMGINFLFIFLPMARTLSIDRLLLKLKYSNTRFQYNPTTKVSVLAYFVPLLVGIAFVYFDSIFYKFSSDFWTKGLGVWLPSSIPVNVFIPLQSVLNQEYLMYFLGYVTVIFETIFIFTFFRKKWRLPLMIIGLGLHIGILISYPIPWFALGMCSIYLLMVPVSLWDKVANIFRRKVPVMTFYYDAECPLCNRTKIIISHFDIQNAIEFKTVQFDSQENPLLKDTKYEDLLDNIYSVKNGKVYSGINTYIQVLSSIVYLKPLSWILRLPIIYHVGSNVYQYIATNRDTERCTEDNCGYTPPTLPPDENKVKLLSNFTLRDLRVKLIAFSIYLICMMQVVISYNSDLNITFREYLGIRDSKVNKTIESFSRHLDTSTRTCLGITHHAVFMDYHFNEYKNIIATVYVDKEGKEHWLPTMNDNGTPGIYQLGFTWVKRTFRTSGNGLNENDMEHGLRDFTAFWAHKNNIDLNDAKFIIKLKKIDIPKHWEKDFLQKQMDKPWENMGEINWEEKKFAITLPDLKSL